MAFSRARSVDVATRALVCDQVDGVRRGKGAGLLPLTKARPSTIGRCSPRSARCSRTLRALAGPREARLGAELSDPTSGRARPRAEGQAPGVDGSPHRRGPRRRHHHAYVHGTPAPLGVRCPLSWAPTTTCSLARRPIESRQLPGSHPVSLPGLHPESLPGGLPRGPSGDSRLLLGRRVQHPCPGRQPNTQPCGWPSERRHIEQDGPRPACTPMVPPHFTLVPTSVSTVSSSETSTSRWVPCTGRAYGTYETRSSGPSTTDGR
jgi:hypothetical protein